MATRVPLPDSITLAAIQDEWAEDGLVVGARVRVAPEFPNIRWAGEYGRIDSHHSMGAMVNVLLESGHMLRNTERRWLTAIPELVEGARVHDSVIMHTHIGTTTGRPTSAQPQTSNVPRPGAAPYAQRSGDALIVGDNGQTLGCVDAQVPLGECRVKVIINGQARWYRMVEAVSREEEAARAKATPYATPSRKLKL